MKKTTGKILHTFSIALTPEQNLAIYREWYDHARPYCAMIAQPRTGPKETGFEILKVAICDRILADRIQEVMPAPKGSKL